MVYGTGNNKEVKNTESHKRNDDDDDDDPNTVDDEFPMPASELLGIPSSGISLDGRSLIVPDGGDDEDMSSLGTSKHGGGYGHSSGLSIGYVGNMRIVGWAGNYGTSGFNPTGIRDDESNHRGDGTGQKNADYDFQESDYSVRTEEKHQPEEKKMEGDLSEKDRRPLWINNAPMWLKLIIIASTALLVGAVVLIVIGALWTENSDSSSSASLDQNSGGNAVPTSAPVVATLPTVSPEVDAPNTEETQGTTSSPTLSIESTSPPSISPALSTLEPTPFDEATGGGTTVPSSVATFFVMGGRFTDLTMLSGGLQMLPTLGGEAVLFHLGDWNSPYTTSCANESFVEHAEMYSRSQIPVYFTVGDNEYNDCPNPAEALELWHQYLLDFETRYWPVPSWNVTRQNPDYPENFAFLNGRVLFAAVNLPGGIVYDEVELENRHTANLQWINATVATHEGNFDVLVVLAHADPEIESAASFFGPFWTIVQSLDERVVFIHRNLGIDTWGLEAEYNGILNLDVVVVQGSVWPPMMVQIDPISGGISIDQSFWFDMYNSTGTLPSGESNVFGDV